MVLWTVPCEKGMFCEQLMYDIITDGTNFYMEYSCPKREGVSEFCVKWEGGQKVGHETQMVYYLILTTHIQVLSTYWVIWC